MHEIMKTGFDVAKIMVFCLIFFLGGGEAGAVFCVLLMLLDHRGSERTWTKQ